MASKSTDKKEFTESEYEIKESITPEDTVGFEDRYEEEETLTPKTWMGKKVYRQVVNYGSWPNTTAKTVKFPTTVQNSTQLDQVIAFYPIRDNTNYVYTSNQTGTSNQLWCAVDNTTTSMSMICSTNYDASGHTGYGVVEYTRQDK